MREREREREGERDRERERRQTDPEKKVMEGEDVANTIHTHIVTIIRSSIELSVYLKLKNSRVMNHTKSLQASDSIVTK